MPLGGDARIWLALVAAARTFFAVLQGRTIEIMANMIVGDPPATLKAVERAHGEVVPIHGTLNWSISQDEGGTVAELAPGDTPDTIKLVAKSGGAVLVRVDDPEFSLVDILAVTITPAPPPPPDEIKIEFIPGTV